MKKIKVGVYGVNGHQIHRHLWKHPAAVLHAAAAVGEAGAGAEWEQVRRYGTLEQLLADEEVELVSLCSPLRREQAEDAVKCLRAGKHVYAEKPCAMSEAGLDAIIAASRETGFRFHEMAGTVVSQPYRKMREAVASGAIGTVVHVHAQKSYPWHDGRPADEDVDGGLAMQVGIYIARFVEHIAGERLNSFEIRETTLGNPRGDSCRMAVVMQGTLVNGGVVSAGCNYLNPLGHTVWGYEILRIFGNRGVVESNADGSVARLLRPGAAPEPLDVTPPTADYFDLFVRALNGGSAMPLSLEDELSPTRWVIRARQAAGPDRTAGDR